MEWYGGRPGFEPGDYELSSAHDPAIIPTQEHKRISPFARSPFSLLSPVIACFFEQLPQACPAILCLASPCADPHDGAGSGSAHSELGELQRGQDKASRARR